MQKDCLGWVLGLFWLILPASAQNILRGQVVDAASRIPLPYANIGIRRQNLGTAARVDGHLTLTIPVNHQADTLTFSMVGYLPPIRHNNNSYFSPQTAVIRNS